MSLQVWLPLIDNTKNIGCLGNILTSDSTAGFTADGKIGYKAMSSGKLYIDGPNMTKIFNNNEFSYCAWLYTSSSTTSGIIFGNDNLRRYSIFRYPNRNDLHISWRNNANSGLIHHGTSIWNNVFPDNQWTHLAIVYKNPDIYIYINGRLFTSSTNNVSDIVSFDAKTCIRNTVGDKINDLRLYNHALSAKDVKEIAQGLIVHYPLNQPERSKNLLTGTNVGKSSWHWNIANGSYTVESDGLTFKAICNTPSTNWECLQRGVPSSVVQEMLDHPNDKFTISFDAYSNGSHTTNAFGLCTGNSLNWVIGFPQVTFKENQWVHYEGTAVPLSPAPTNCGQVLYLSGVIYSSGKYVSIKNLKIERSPIATQYTPAPTDGKYSQNIEYDTSGYGNNGTLSTSHPTMIFDAPNYTRGYKFVGPQYINLGNNIRPKDAITVSYWIKGTTVRPVSCTQGGGFNIENLNGTHRLLIYVNGGYKIIQFSKNMATLATDWHMITFTYDGYKSVLYIDGVKDGELAISTTKLPITYAASNVNLYINAEAEGNGGTTSETFGTNNAPSMSDFRIYCTALSPEAVKELYNAKTAIDNFNSIHSFEFNEVSGSNVKVNKTGVVESSLITENDIKLKYDQNIYIEPDGSAWYRIFHHANCSTKLFASNNDFANGVYIDADRWFNVNVCNYLNKWEFMAKVKYKNTQNLGICRWSQTSNPMTSTSTSVTQITGANGGLVRCSGNTYLACSNSTGNWWNAVGSYTYHIGGVPGIAYDVRNDSTIITTGYQDLYVRIDNCSFTSATIPDKTKFYQGGTLVTKEVIEK